MVAPVTIVFLHGMAGGHLQRDDGRKAWLGAAGLMRGSVAGDLRGPLNPAGHIKLFHRPATLYWRRRGFTVHEFAYDWRLSLDAAAERLREFIAALPDRRLIVAAHSMGGCVACRFSALYPEEAARVERAWFFGVPVRGTFSVVEVLLGRFLMTRLVAGASLFRRRGEVLGDLAQACAAMPGLIELLPDPALFPSASILYDRSNWPAQCAPEQALLDRALALKLEMPRSPILDRTIVLASANWRTPGAVERADGGLRLTGETVPGDRVAPFASTTPLPGMSVHPLRFPHAFLLLEPAGLRASTTWGTRAGSAPPP